jgi:hypothetical protein
LIRKFPAMNYRAIFFIVIVKINVRLMSDLRRIIGGCRPPCRHIFNMINDIDRMDRQGRRPLPISCDSHAGQTTEFLALTVVPFGTKNDSKVRGHFASLLHSMQVMKYILPFIFRSRLEKEAISNHYLPRTRKRETEVDL